MTLSPLAQAIVEVNALNNDFKTKLQGSITDESCKGCYLRTIGEGNSQRLTIEKQGSGFWDRLSGFFTRISERAFYTLTPTKEGKDSITAEKLHTLRNVLRNANSSDFIGALDELKIANKQISVANFHDLEDCVLKLDRFLGIIGNKKFKTDEKAKSAFLNSFKIESREVTQVFTSPSPLTATIDGKKGVLDQYQSVERASNALESVKQKLPKEQVIGTYAIAKGKDVNSGVLSIVDGASYEFTIDPTTKSISLPSIKASHLHSIDDCLTAISLQGQPKESYLKKDDKLFVVGMDGSIAMHKQLPGESDEAFLSRVQQKTDLGTKNISVAEQGTVDRELRKAGTRAYHHDGATLHVMLDNGVIQKMAGVSKENAAAEAQKLFPLKSVDGSKLPQFSHISTKERQITGHFNLASKKLQESGHYIGATTRQTAESKIEANAPFVFKDIGQGTLHIAYKVGEKSYIQPLDITDPNQCRFLHEGKSISLFGEGAFKDQNTEQLHASFMHSMKESGILSQTVDTITLPSIIQAGPIVGNSTQAMQSLSSIQKQLKEHSIGVYNFSKIDTTKNSLNVIVGKDAQIAQFRFENGKEPGVYTFYINNKPYPNITVEDFFLELQKGENSELFLKNLPEGSCYVPPGSNEIYVVGKDHALSKHVAVPREGRIEVDGDKFDDISGYIAHHDLNELSVSFDPAGVAERQLETVKKLNAFARTSSNEDLKTLFEPYKTTEGMQEPSPFFVPVSGKESELRFTIITGYTSENDMLVKQEVTVGRDGITAGDRTFPSLDDMLKECNCSGFMYDQLVEPSFRDFNSTAAALEKVEPNTFLVWKDQAGDSYVSCRRLGATKAEQYAVEFSDGTYTLRGPSTITVQGELVSALRSSFGTPYREAATKTELLSTIQDLAETIDKEEVGKRIEEFKTVKLAPGQQYFTITTEGDNILLTTYEKKRVTGLAFLGVTLTESEEVVPTTYEIQSLLNGKVEIVGNGKKEVFNSVKALNEHLRSDKMQSLKQLASMDQGALEKLQKLVGEAETGEFSYDSPAEAKKNVEAYIKGLGRDVDNHCFVAQEGTSLQIVYSDNGVVKTKKLEVTANQIVVDKKGYSSDLSLTAVLKELGLTPMTLDHHSRMETVRKNENRVKEQGAKLLQDKRFANITSSTAQADTKAFAAFFGDAAGMPWVIRPQAATLTRFTNPDVSHVIITVFNSQTQKYSEFDMKINPETAKFTTDVGSFETIDEAVQALGLTSKNYSELTADKKACETKEKEVEGYTGFRTRDALAEIGKDPTQYNTGYILVPTERKGVYSLQVLADGKLTEKGEISTRDVPGKFKLDNDIFQYDQMASVVSKRVNANQMQPISKKIPVVQPRLTSTQAQPKPTTQTQPKPTTTQTSQTVTSKPTTSQPLSQPVQKPISQPAPMDRATSYIKTTSKFMENGKLEDGVLSPFDYRFTIIDGLPMIVESNQNRELSDTEIIYSEGTGYSLNERPEVGSSPTIEGLIIKFDTMWPQIVAAQKQLSQPQPNVTTTTKPITQPTVTSTPVVQTPTTKPVVINLASDRYKILEYSSDKKQPTPETKLSKVLKWLWAVETGKVAKVGEKKISTEEAQAIMKWVGEYTKFTEDNRIDKKFVDKWFTGEWKTNAPTKDVLNALVNQLKNEAKK